VPVSSANRRTHLDLQDVVATHTLVMHIMVRVIRIAAVLVLDKREAVQAGQICAPGTGSRRANLQPAAGRARGGDIAAHQPAIATPSSLVSISKPAGNCIKEDI
jgi:hypothetical protein